VTHTERRSRRPLAWAVAGMAVLPIALGTTPADAHAIVKRTEPRIGAVVPEPPRRILMEFNEPVEISFGSIRVYDTLGRRVDQGAAAYVVGRADAVAVPLQADLPRGTYTVAWRIVSADGHPIGEAFVFHIGAPGENPRGVVDEILSGEGRAGALESALAAVGRWLALGSLLLLGGAALFLALVWGRVLSPQDVGARFASRWRRVVVAAWVTTLVSTVLLFILQGALAADLPIAQAISPNVLGEVAETRFGIVSLIRLGLLLACAAIWPAVRRSLEPGRSVGAAAAAVRPTATLMAIGGSLILALLATPGVAGHAGTTEPVALNMTADALHMLAAAGWMGGLLLLIGGAFPATRGLTEVARARTLAPVVARFSDLAVVAVAALVVSGLVRTWAEVRAIRALTDATYGLVLLLKVAAVAPILVLGVINNRWTKPRIVRAVAEGHPDRAQGPLRTLRRLVAVEVALGVVVVGITALLVNLPPARVAAGVEGPATATASIGPHELHVMVDPNRVGENTIHLQAATRHGEPADFDEVRLLFRMQAEGIGPIVARAEEMSPGRFVLHGHQLSVPGDWTIEIVGRTGKFEEDRATVNLTVNP
jgi:copper transport protein